MTNPYSPGPQQPYDAQQPYGAQQSYGAPPAYALPVSGYGRTTNALAVISMISSIVGLFSFAILCIAGVIMGHIALGQIKRRDEAGRGMAIAALIVGYAGIAFWILLVVAWVAFLGIFVTAAGASGALS